MRSSHNRRQNDSIFILRKTLVKFLDQSQPSASKQKDRDPMASQSIQISSWIQLATLKWAAPKDLQWTPPKLGGQVSSRTTDSRYWRTSPIVSHLFLNHQPMILSYKRLVNWVRYLRSKMNLQRCWWPNLINQILLQPHRKLPSSKWTT